MLNLPHRAGKGVILLFVLVIIGLAFSSILVISIGGRAAGTPIPDEVVSDTMIPPTDEGRARFGNIFVGEVVAVAGEDKIPTSDPEDILPVIIYDVEVEQTLKGDASGRIQIWYEGFQDKGPDAEKAGELRVGERYLFFAGFDPDKKWYPVNAGLGVTPVKNDQEAAELVATFEPLIRQAERQADQRPAADPCEEVGSPTISVEPAQTTAGNTVHLSGENFVRPQVSIWWDGADDRLATADVTENCSIDVELKIPKADAGEHRVIVEDARGESAEAILVTKE